MRIYFTPGDLALTRLSDGPDAMWELVNSLQALQSRYGQAELQHWRSDVAGRLRESGIAAAVRHRLFPVAPHAAYFPDLLTPLEGALGLDAGIDAILSTPRERMRTEFGRLTPGRSARGWLDDLQTKRAKPLAAWSGLLRSYYRHAVQSIWEPVESAVESDLSARRAVLRSGGVNALLSSFQPFMRWQYPVLELPGHPSQRDVRLDGRGLRLIPSYFCRLHPLTIYDDRLPQVVVYPISHQVARISEVAEMRALARLLGETRAAVLVAVRSGCGTGEVAHRLAISAAAASHHVGILRDAGLIVTNRTADGIRHTRTRLGDALISRHLRP